MKEILIALFGEYQPVMTTMVVTAEDGTATTIDVIASGVAGVDWLWVAGVVLFGIVLLSFFRIVGGLLKR